MASHHGADPRLDPINDPACRGADPALFHPIADDWNPARPHHARQIREAKAVCDRCPLVDACLRYAVESGDAWAILGRTTPAERKGLLRQHQAAQIDATIAEQVVQQQPPSPAGMRAIRGADQYGGLTGMTSETTRTLIERGWARRGTPTASCPRNIRLTPAGRMLRDVALQRPDVDPAALVELAAASG